MILNYCNVVILDAAVAVVEVYQSWCGPCKAVASILKKLYFDMSDKPLKFYTVSRNFSTLMPAMQQPTSLCPAAENNQSPPLAHVVAHFLVKLWS